MDKDDISCDRYSLETQDWLYQTVRTGDIVFVGQDLIDSRRISTEYIKFIKDFAFKINGKGVPLVLLDDVVSPESDPRECYLPPWRLVDRDNQDCFLTRADVVRRYAKFDELALLAVKEINNLFYAPIRTGLCSNRTVCGQKTSNGTPIWHGKGHITEASSELLAVDLINSLNNQLFFKRYKSTWSSP